MAKLKTTGGLLAALALLIVLALPASAASESTPSDTEALKQQCIAAALEKPPGVEVSVRHAGHNSGRHQAAVLVAQYRAMPEACRGKYYRGNHAMAQVFRNGKWARINTYERVYGGTWTPGEGTSSYIDNQVAFTGRYYGLPLVTAGDKPRLFNPCRVRILLKESVTRPEPRPTDGYFPHHNIAQRVYAFPVPLRRIWPHRGQSCELLAMRRYSKASLSEVPQTTTPDTGQTVMKRPQHRSSNFEPGHYVGYTSQKCTAEAATTGACTVGQKLPISFTVTSRKLRALNTLAIARCSDGLPAIVRVLDYPQAVPLVRSGKGSADGVLFSRQFFVPDSIPAFIDQVTGVIRGQKADGLLSSFITVDETGQPDPKGTGTCSSGRLHWHVWRQGVKKRKIKGKTKYVKVKQHQGNR